MGRYQIYKIKMSTELFNIDFPYSFKPSPEQLEVLRAASKSETPPGLQEDGTLDWRSRSHLLTLDEAFSVSPKFEITGRTKYARISDLDDLKIDDFGVRPILPQMNNKCNVVVAGTTVIDIDEVLLAPDYCTNSLQEHLNEGWRILAICVQPDQRRPDYILGRIKKNS